MNLIAAARPGVASRVEEFIRYDAGRARIPFAYAALAAAELLRQLGRHSEAFGILTRIHGMAISDRLNQRIAGRLRRDIEVARGDRTSAFARICLDYVQSYGKDGTLRPELRDPRRMLGSRIIVLKSPSTRERGVLVLGYSYVFPLFAQLFNVPAIARRYHMVLEPSWCGFCTPDVLLLAGYDFPVFVECWEPHDREFLDAINSNLVPIPVADNWWVDHRVLRPDPSMTKDIDVIMIAAWAHFKRHRQFFRALGDLRRTGERLKVALLGYPVDRTADDIMRDARDFGVEEQIEIHENLPTEGVARMLARSKVHVLWSRREGGNRAHVEAMFCDVPCILRDGFNFGYKQPHVNDQTGSYAREDTLAQELARMVRTHRRFAPRDWVMKHISCQRATQIMEDVIRTTAARELGEVWTKGLAVKTVMVNTQKYWDHADVERFAKDYAFLESQIM